MDAARVVVDSVSGGDFMTVRDDILRGVRLGAIVLAVVLTGAIVYRMIHIVPAPAPAPSAPTPESVAQVPPSYPDVPSTSVPVPPPPLARSASFKSRTVSGRAPNSAAPSANPVTE